MKKSVVGFWNSMAVDDGKHIVDFAIDLGADLMADLRPFAFHLVSTCYMLGLFWG